MRILQVVPHYVPAYHFGGVLRVAHAMSRALAKQGHPVHVCTTNLRDPTQYLDLPTDVPIDVDGVKVFYEPVSVSRYWGFSRKMAHRLWEEIRWADVVLIHFHYQFSSLVGGWLSRLQRKPYIVFTHGSLNRHGVNSRGTFRKRMYLRFLESGNLGHASFVGYQSHEEMENSLKWGNPEVVPNGIDPQEYSELPPLGYFRKQYPALADQVVYLYLGRLHPGKGFDLLLPAFGELAQKLPDVHLLLAGCDERGYERTVRQMISDLHLDDYVTLTGFVSGQDRLGALQDSDVFVLPSRSEGLSGAMLEAMYMALPVVVTDRVGLCREIRKRRCGLVVPFNQEHLTRALQQIAVTPDRKEMGRRGHELVSSHYTWDSIARDLVNRIQELI